LALPKAAKNPPLPLKLLRNNCFVCWFVFIGHFVIWFGRQAGFTPHRGLYWVLRYPGSKPNWLFLVFFLFAAAASRGPHPSVRFFSGKTLTGVEDFLGICTPPGGFIPGKRKN
jgi:hypothetical protein